MKVLIIDNYDSFTYNLYQYAGEILENKKDIFQLDVIRNDELTFDEIFNRKYDRIIISPGPGEPSNKDYFGVCSDVITKIGLTTPILGVCLGMQGIAHLFGGKVVRAKEPMHGKTSQIIHDENGVFKNLPQNIQVMRYHSLITEIPENSNELLITAKVAGKNDGEIMGLRHKKYPIEGIQFHPESFATEGGMEMLENFLFQN